jgi:hypothetical protein
MLRSVRSLVRILALAVLLTAVAQAVSFATLAEGTSEVVPLASDTFPGCAWNCSANDVRIQTVWLGDGAGNPIMSCPESGSIPAAYVWVTLNNGTGTERYYVSLLAKLQVGDGPMMSISPCLLSPLLSGGVTQALILTQVTDTPCSSVITLSEVIIPWVTSPEADISCGGRPAACNPSWPSGQAWCGGPYTIDVVPQLTPTAMATGSPTATATLASTPVNTPALTLAPQDDPTATSTLAPTTAQTSSPSAVPTATGEPVQPVLPASGTGAAGGAGSLASLALALLGGAAYWLRRRAGS